MRIAYLSTDPGIAYGGTKGASVHLSEMAAAMAREGAEVLLLVARIEPGAAAPSPGVTVQRLPGPARGASAAERVSVALFGCRSVASTAPSRATTGAASA